MSEVAKETGYFKSFDGTPIYYEVRGQGEPLVFVYGIACLMNHWHHQIEHFSKNYKTIVFDLRGHHKSSQINSDQNLNIPSLADDLVGLLQHLNIEKAHFAGHSFGVPVLLSAYEKDPDLFKSLILINGFSKNPIKGMFGLDIVEPFFFSVKNQYQKNPEFWNQIWRKTVNNPIAMTVAGLLGGFNLKLTQFKDIEVYARGVSQLDLAVFIPFFEALMEFNGDLILPKIHCPTLIISGENDNVTPQQFQVEMKSLIPTSELVTIPYGSHCTHLDFPDYVNLKIDSFLTGPQFKT